MLILVYYEWDGTMVIFIVKCLGVIHESATGWYRFWIVYVWVYGEQLIMNVWTIIYYFIKVWVKDDEAVSEKKKEIGQVCMMGWGEKCVNNGWTTCT